MDKLKILSKVMVILGLISFLGGIIATMKELMEFGLFAGVGGIVVYAVTYIISSTSIAEHDSSSE